MKKFPLLSIAFLGLIVLGVVLSPAQTAQGGLPMAPLDGISSLAGDQLIGKNYEPTSVPGLEPSAVDAITVTWVSPVGNDEVYHVGCQTVRLEVTVQSTRPVQRVRFYYWDYVKEQFVTITNVFQPPYEYDFYTCPLNPDFNQIFARAFDVDGNSSDREHIWLVKHVAYLPLIGNQFPTTLALDKQVINNNGGTAVPTDWTLSASGPTPISGPGGVGPSPVKPGTYTLSEDGPAGYATGNWVCDGGTQNGNQITLSGGENVTCTITNNDIQPMLTLVKEVINNNGGANLASEWTLTAAGIGGFTGTGVQDGVLNKATLGPRPVIANVTYNLSESGPGGYATGVWVCTGGGTQVGSSITVGNGESVTCTITNNDIQPMLTLVKVVENNNGGSNQASEWTLTAAGIGGFTDTGVQDGQQNKATLGPRPVIANVAYALSESGPAGYIASAWVCEGGTQVGNTISVAPGGAATCTITNDDVADLAVLKDDGLTTVVAGDAIVHTYVITVTNNGAADAATVSLIDTWPVGFAQGTVTPSQGTCGAAGGNFTCALGPIGSGGLATVEADYTVPAGTGVGLQTNSVSVSTTTTEPDTSNNSATDDTTVTVEADLGLTKTVNIPNPLVGTNVIFSVVAANNGPSNATGIVITDTLPTGYTYVSHGVTQGVYSNATGLWNAGDIASALSATLTITATVNPGGNYTNSAEVTAMNESDPNPANDSDSAFTTPIGAVDVSITKEVNNGTPSVGTNVVFTITAANSGPSTATGVVVTDLLPTGYTYVSDVPSLGSYVPGTGVWTVGTIAPAGSETLSITASVDPSGNYENTATLTGVNENDTNGANNSDSAITNPVPAVDISITKIVDDPTPDVGANVEFTITAANAGPSTATGVVVTDLLPNGYSYVSDTPSQGSYVSGTGVWTVGTINSAASATLTLTASVNASGEYNNTASLTSVVEDDTSSANNQDSASTTPVPVVDLSITKNVDNETPDVLTDVVFTIVVANAGPSTATGVQVNDDLPTGYAYDSNSTSQGNYITGNGNWNVGILASGSSATLTITATVNLSGDYTNSASVINVNESDPNGGNDSDSASTTPVGVVDLSITKNVDNPTPAIGADVEFTIVVDNAGPSEATGVEVTDLLPSGYSYVSHSASLGSYISGSGVWTVGSIASGGSETLTLTGTVQAAGEYNNTATVTGVNESDSNGGNDSDSASTTPLPQ